MQGDRLSVNKPVYTSGRLGAESRESRSKDDNTTTGKGRSRCVSGSSPGTANRHRSRRQSVSPSGSRGQRGHAPSRTPLNQSPGSLANRPNVNTSFRRPWDTNSRSEDHDTRLQDIRGEILKSATLFPNQLSHYQSGHKSIVRYFPGRSKPYSPILSCLGKLFTSVLNNRLTAFLEENNILDENQAGFRKGYSCSDHIFTLHALIEIA